MHNKNSFKLEIEVCSLNLVKGIYRNPKETVPGGQEQDKNNPITTSTQYYVGGPSQYSGINAIM